MKTFSATVYNKIIIPCMFTLLFLTTIGNFEADAELSCFSSITTATKSNYKGGVFVDSYWTDRSASSENIINPIEIEVGPGEGPSTLAVVLTNNSDEELIAVKGFLKLPNGFKPHGLSIDPKSTAFFGTTKGSTTFTNAAVASHPSAVGPGATITLYFDIDITNSTSVGPYAGQLVADYSTTRLVNSCKSALLNVPFILPGKVILDVVSENQYIFPETSNPVDISITNRGSADATGVVATITGLGEDGSRSSGSGSSVTLQSSDTSLVNLGPNSFNVGTIPAGKTVKISTSIFPDTTAASTVQNLDLQLSYGNSYGYKQSTAIRTGLVVSPKAAESSVMVSSSSAQSTPLITAGKVGDFSFEVKNNGKNPMTDVLLTLAGESESLKIVGNSKWSIDVIAPGETKELTAKVFAAVSMINTPTSFNLTTEYISNGEAKIDTSTIGAYVSGDINLVLYDIGVNQIGNSLYIVGNVLNQGSTTGKFTSIELVSFSPLDLREITTPGQPSPSEAFGEDEIDFGQHIPKITPQYIGDLTEDSSIPFSIPLPLSSINQGTYPISFKIVYADDLKIFHEVELFQEITVDRVQLGGSQRGSSDRGSDDSSFMTLILLGILGVSVVVGVFMVKKTKFSKLKLKDVNSSSDDEDLDKILNASKDLQKKKSSES